MRITFKNLAEQASQWIMCGKTCAAQELLNVLPKIKLSRGELLQAATLSRRADLPELALKILNPVMRVTGRGIQQASDEEKTEYAACLTKVGAVTEALNLLLAVDSSRVPEALKFEAFCYFSQWEYKAAIIPLQRYIQSSKLEDYPKVVGRVNLAAAYVYERVGDEAKIELEELRELTKTRGYTLLFMNVLELSAQNAINERQWEKADKYLSLAESLASDEKSLDAFYVRKWRAICNLFWRPKNGDSRKSLDEIRLDAVRLHRYETLRDCDRFQSIATHDLKMFHKVVFGTPFLGFRKWLLSDFGASESTLPSSYVWCLSKKGKPKECVDIRPVAKSDGSAVLLKRGGLPYQLFCILSSDFYKPFRLPCLHAHLYRGELYNPLSSSDRMHRVMERLRLCLQQKKIHLIIRHDSENYSLAADGRVAIRVSLPGTFKGKTSQLTESLRANLLGKVFSSSEAGRILGISKRSAQRFLRTALESGEVEREEAGADTRYRLRKAG